MGDECRWLTVSEAAYELGVAPRTVRRMLDRGDLVHRDLNAHGRYRVARIPASELVRVQPQSRGGTLGGTAETSGSGTGRIRSGVGRLR